MEQLGQPAKGLAEGMSVPFLPSTDPTAAGELGRKRRGSPRERKGTATGDSRGGRKVSAELEEQRRGQRRDGGTTPAEDPQEVRAGVRARAAGSGEQLRAPAKGKETARRGSQKWR